jgi:two-component system phosphate regulon sensor histidine kinase PhoR
LISDSIRRVIERSGDAGYIVWAAWRMIAPRLNATSAILINAQVLDLTLATLAGVAIGALAVTVLIMHRRWVSPVRSLARSAELMASGQWGTRSDLNEGAAEVLRLRDQLNGLAGQAQSQFDALSAQRGNLQLLVDALPDPILLCDRDDQIVMVNAPAERLLGVPPQLLYGRKFVSVVSDASILDLFEEVVRARPASGGTRPAPIHREIRLVRDGQRLSFQALSEVASTGGVLIILRDVSTLAGAIQMKTDFVANASHELRTPISAIKVAFETLRDVYEEDPALTARCITIIDGHLRRLEEMLRDLLDLSRVESGDLKPHMSMLRTADLLAVVRATWQGAAREKGVTLEFPSLAEQEFGFVSDRRLLELVLKNLVENAIKFTPSGGKVTLMLRAAATADAGVVLTVSDTGCGIPAEHLERVFERFYQVDPARSGAGRGTGLGLAIVKHAVHALNGTIRITSEIGQGTTVTCWLPSLSEGDHQESEAA